MKRMNFKKSLTSIIFSNVIVGASLIAGCSSQQFTYGDWDKIKKAQESIKKIQHVEYGYEFWNSPKKTIEDGYGECVDIAILGAYEAELCGYEPKIMLLVREESGKLKQHAATLLEEKNNEKTKYGAFDDKFLLYPEHDSIDELIPRINKFYNRNYGYYAVLDLNSQPDWKITSENLLDFKGEKVFNLTKVKF